MKVLVIVVAVLSAAMAVAAESKAVLQPARVGAAERLGELEHPALKESSGLAASRRDPRILWTHNDSKAKPVLFACTIQGKHLAVVVIQGARARDWEDIAAFSFQGKAWLLIADVGDNRARRQGCVLYVVEEPAVDFERTDQELEVPVAWKLVFTYEDGPRDCEAVGVDAASGQVFLVSKRTVPAVLYSLPLRPEGDGHLVARRHVALALIPQLSAQDLAEHLRFGLWPLQPTAMDVAPDGSIALVLTYRHTYLFPRRKGEPWEKAFARLPQLVSLPKRRQGESGCFSADGRAIIVGSEGRPAPLWRLSIDTTPSN